MSAIQQRQVFLLPDLGEGLTEAELVNWLVAVGEDIAIDQPIAEVETAKSVVEVPSPFAGTVAVLHGEAGTTIDVGTPLISVDATDVANSADVAAPDASAHRDEGADLNPAGETYREEERAGVQAPEKPIEPSGEEAAEPADAGSGNVLIGYGTPGGAGGTKRTRARKASVGEYAAPPRRAENRDAPLVTSPLVRKLARESGLKLADVRGSGPGGLILRKDVEAARAPREGSTETREADAKSGLGVAQRTPIKGLRKTVAANLTRSRTEIPEATVWVDVDATALVEMRAGLKAADTERTPGLLAFIARFVVAGLAKFPELNSRIEGEEIIGFDGVNLGFAAQTDRGLMVPSVRRAETMSARGLDAEIRRLTAVVREGKASPAELTSGTFTLNNYGVFGVDGSAAIINYPEVAILGVGRIIDKPWVLNGELAVRKVTELTLTFDHRVCDGGTAGGFLRYVADAMENPGSVLADL